MKTLFLLFCLLLTLPALAEEGGIDKIGLTIGVTTWRDMAGSPPAGKKFVVVEAYVAASKAHTLKLTHFKLKCGDSITSGKVGAPTNPLAEGELAAGESTSGAILFAIEAGAKLSSCQAAYSTPDGTSPWLKASASVSPLSSSSPSKYRGTKGVLTIPGPASLDGFDPASGTIIKSISLWSEPDGGHKVGTLTHGQTVTVIAPPSESEGRAQVRVGDAEGWLNEGFLKPKK